MKLQLAQSFKATGWALSLMSFVSLALSSCDQNRNRYGVRQDTRGIVRPYYNPYLNNLGDADRRSTRNDDRYDGRYNSRDDERYSSRRDNRYSPYTPGGRDPRRVEAPRTTDRTATTRDGKGGKAKSEVKVTDTWPVIKLEKRSLDEAALKKIRGK